MCKINTIFLKYDCIKNIAISKYFKWYLNQCFSHKWNSECFSYRKKSLQANTLKDSILKMPVQKGTKLKNICNMLKRIIEARI